MTISFRCALCAANASAEAAALRPCSKCAVMLPMCWLCADGKDSGSVSFDHGCTDNGGNTKDQAADEYREPRP